MELKELCDNTLEIVEIADIKDLGVKLFMYVKHNNTDIYDKFKGMVSDLSIDWLQKIFQYYYADRTEKKQDYTPKTLADFMGRLVGDSEIVIDMCAGSGALTIQKWNLNHDTKFILYEYDERVIPFLTFNMAIRNIECVIYHADVLQEQIFKVYQIQKGEKYGIFKEVENGDSISF